MFSLIAPPAFSGTVLGLVPIIIMTLAVYVLLYGPPYMDTTDWVLDSYKLHYMDAAVDPDNYAKARWIAEVFEKGFIYGAWYNKMWYAQLLQDPCPNPRPSVMSQFDSADYCLLFLCRSIPFTPQR